MTVSTQRDGSAHSEAPPRDDHHLLDLELVSFASGDAAATSLLAQARSRARGSAVFTCNVDHLMVMAQRRDFRAAYQRADTRTIDGAPLALLCRATGAPRARRITGIDLSHELARVAARDGLRLALVGGRPGRAERAAGRLRDEFGPFETFCASPSFGFQPGDAEDAALVERLRRFAPHIVVVCLGAPKQELWIDVHRDALPGALLIGAGATIDVLSGQVRRAPALFRRTGTEAAYRLGTDFRRLWRRYLVRDLGFLALFPLVVLRHRVARRRWAARVGYSPAHPGADCPGPAPRWGRGCRAGVRALDGPPAPTPVRAEDVPRVDIASVREIARVGGEP